MLMGRVQTQKIRRDWTQDLQRLKEVSTVNPLYTDIRLYDKICYNDNLTGTNLHSRDDG